MAPAIRLRRTVALALAMTCAVVMSGEARAAVQLLGPEQGIPQGGISSLLAAHGRLYIGTNGKGLIAYDPVSKKTRIFTRSDGLPSDDVKSLALFGGKVYAGTSEGIGVEEGGRWTAVAQAGQVTLRNVVLATAPDAAELWACSVYLAGGTVVYDGKEWRFVGGEGRGLFNDISAFAFFPGGVLMGAASGAVYARKGGEIESLKAGFPPANVSAVAERGGTYYAGTSKGLYLWRGEKWGAVRVPPPFEGSAIFSIRRSEVDLFVGGVRGLLLLDKSGATRVISEQEGFPGGPVFALAEEDGTLYAATDRGVAVLSGWRD